ncbi:hypothetical protein J4402_00115 [Candidatus Pacearchaeota archaeon]|nr:hypothetical protein [Candidatus Pacearchaeota archaeon]
MFKFKKIASVLATTAMLTSTVALAAATTYPAPFVTNGAADVAVVYGSHTAASVDLVGVLKIQDSLNSFLSSSTATAGATPSGGDYVLLAKASDNLNLGNTWGVFSGNVDKDELSTLLADGTYVTDDNDEFEYEQTIALGSPGLEHFRDSDYESAAGLSERTPTVGFKLPSSKWILNYTIDFTTDAESDITTGEFEDFETSTLRLLGKDYYISDFDVGGISGMLGKLTLLDSAVTGIVNEGETATKTMGDKSYDVSIVSLTTTQAKLSVNGETTNMLSAGSSYKLSDGTYVGVKEIFQRDVSGVVGNIEFSLGSGKLEITSGSTVKLNDENVDGIKAWVYNATGSGSTTGKMDKIVLEWKTDDELFLTPKLELAMPGFNAVKFSMNDLRRQEEEKITIDNDGDTSIKLTVPIKDGTVGINLVYANSTGELIGIGKATDQRLLTVAPNETKIQFYEKFNGADWHEYFVASYNISSQAESYLLRAKVLSTDSSGINRTTLEKYGSAGWESVCADKKAGDSCNIGLVSLTIDDVNYTSGKNETASFAAGTNVNFQTIYTAGGLKIFLPFAAINSTLVREGELHVNDSGGGSAEGLPTGPVGTDQAGENWTIGINGVPSTTGHSGTSFWLFMKEEDKDDNIAAGTTFNFTIDDNTDSNLYVSQVNTAGSGGPSSGVGGVGGLEVGDATSVYEAYLNGSDVATRILHYTKPDEDYAEVYYPAGTDGASETYAEVFLTETDAVLSGSSGGSTSTIGVAITDAEVSQASNKNLVVVGGSCVNSVAADLLGSSTPLCGADWETATGVGAGSYLIQTFERTGGNVATLVAGYNAGDTQNAATALTTQTVDTTAGKKYTGSTATSITSVTTTA